MGRFFVGRSDSLWCSETAKPRPKRAPMQNPEAPLQLPISLGSRRFDFYDFGISVDQILRSGTARNGYRL
jgi:hypothetical protein